jgi:hypothetical protein
MKPLTDNIFLEYANGRLIKSFVFLGFWKLKVANDAKIAYLNQRFPGAIRAGKSAVTNDKEDLILL